MATWYSIVLMYHRLLNKFSIGHLGYLQFVTFIHSAVISILICIFVNNHDLCLWDKFLIYDIAGSKERYIFRDIDIGIKLPFVPIYT